MRCRNHDDAVAVLRRTVLPGGQYVRTALVLHADELGDEAAVVYAVDGLAFDVLAIFHDVRHLKQRERAACMGVRRERDGEGTSPLIALECEG